MFERFVATLDKKPVGKKPENTQKAPDNIQKSPAPINEEEINAKRRRAGAPECTPILRAEEDADDRPTQSASCQSDAADANGEVYHCDDGNAGEAQQVHSRGVHEVTGFHTAGPEREENPTPRIAFTVQRFNDEKRILTEQVRTLMLNLYVCGCDAMALEQVQWGDKLREIAATVLAEIDADDKNEDVIIDPDPKPTVQPDETQPTSFPNEHTFDNEEKVFLQGLVTRPDLNGRAGIVLEQTEEDGSLHVKVIPVRDGGYEVKSSELIRAKPENLRRPIPFEIAYFQYFY